MLLCEVKFDIVDSLIEKRKKPRGFEYTTFLVGMSYTSQWKTRRRVKKLST
jgi:hypothetical protein